MGVDVINLVEGYIGVGQCHLHRCGSAATRLLGLHRMPGVAGGTEARQLRQDVNAPC